MSMDADCIVRSQYEIFGKISRSFENLKKAGAANVTFGLVEARLHALESYWTKFENQHDKINAHFWDAVSSHEYTTGNLPTVAEEAYLTQKGLFLDALRTLKARENAETAAVSPSAVTTAVVPHPPRSTLPRIQLPQFSGRYEDWPSFRDLFCSIIGRDSSTTKVEKLHYLKTCIKGEAELLVRSLPTTDENFERAWKVLSDYYENKRLLTRSYLSQFTSLQKLKGESATDLRKLCHNVRSIVGSLASVGRPISRGEDLFVHLVVDLLDARSRREWETALGEETEPPSYDELQRFLDKRLHTLESLQPAKSEISSSKTSSETGRQTRALHMRKQENRRGRCSLCQKEHYIMFCEAFQQKTAEERKQHVKENNLCFNCLGKHKVNECASKKTCATCQARHHTTLHDACQTNEVAKTSHIVHQPLRSPVTVLLATARVRVSDRFGVAHSARALVDQGSESSLVSESLAQRLRLTRAFTSVAVFGVGGQKTGSARGLVTLRVSAMKGGLPITVPALVLPRITLYDGGIHSNSASWKHIDDLQLADPDFMASDPVEILLGADVHASILQPGLRKGSPLEPVAQKTTLGWILSGAVGSAAEQRHTTIHQCRVEEEDLPSLVRRFWTQEEMPASELPLTPEDQACEDLFLRTHTRTSEGRYVVKLPVITPLPNLTATRSSAQRVLFSMERRFLRESRLQQLYVDFLQQYEDLGHMTKVREIESAGNQVSYLPHHGVLREASTTTKLRVVFNGSMTISTGDSLNKYLMTGQNLLPLLADVLLRWRQHRFVLVADVEKMFRQILVHPEDRDLQRIIWRYPGQEKIDEYRLNTVTYGLACAPFLAIRSLRQLANDEEERFPQAAAVLRRDVYMDDFLTGSSTFSGAQELQRQLTGLCSAGGFPLRKWSSNEPALLADLPADHRMQRELRAWHPHETHSTLGLRWHPSEDSFAFDTSNLTLKVVTKRSVLSLTARLFDPLGWLAPTVVSAKIAIQATWLQSLEWDTPLEEESSQRWQNFLSELPVLKEIRVPRWIGPLEPDAEMEIHGFADASEKAFAAVIYLRTLQEEKWITRLVMSKTKVAPLKQVSLPRLELCASVLLARLASHVRTTLHLTKAPLHLWTDSTVALGWIRGHPTRWRTYVANRVANIQSVVPEALWYHVPSQENPADCASRGLTPRELVKHHLWWKGPSWLHSAPKFWPSTSSDLVDKELPETRTKVHAASRSHPTEEPDELRRFSSLYRLLRVTAWCRRWLRLRSSKCEAYSCPADILTSAEVEDAHLLWIRRVQTENFKEELKAIRQGQTLAKSNVLTRLNPFIGHQGLLRVGGRLKHAILAYDERHPVILSSDSLFTQFIVDMCHRRTLHGGVQLTLATIRQQYWIPRGRTVVKRCIHRCINCLRWRAATPQQLMSNLPRERVTPARPFIHTGVDYAGPIWLRTTKGRGHRAYKAFIAVFVCLSTRAVHLEVASDYSSDAFLAALRRFTARRGMCKIIQSDCGTNFVGADAQLRRLFASSNAEHRKIVSQLASEQIQWRFNPPAAPHFGGIWEAAVKSLKHHLRRVVGDTTLTFEEMSTLLSQIEACLNSRPLQALSDDPEDLAALTPGHFLIGSALTSVPEPSLLNQQTSRLTRWQLLQKMRDHFWDRWSREYLHSLVHRPNWWTKESGFDVGRLCLIRNETTPPTKWPLARIIHIHPGEDGQIRVVTVRTAATELTRPISKLILLPVTDEEAKNPKESATSIVVQANE